MIVAGLFGLAMVGAAFTGQPTECDRLAGSSTDANKVGAGIGLYGIEPLEALAACEKTLAADPNNPRLLFNLGRAHEASGHIGSSW
ncbi:tetratricopeptide repeat protein [Mesorhizobium sp. ORM6]